MKPTEVRPCLVNGNEAYFHQWAQNSEYVPGRGIITYPVAIIEYADNGMVFFVCPDETEFIFTDRKED